MARNPEDNKRINDAASQASNLLRARNAARAADERPITVAPHASAGNTQRGGSAGGRGRHGRPASHNRGPRPNSLGNFVRRNSVYILSVLGVVVIFALLLAFLHPSSTAPDPRDATEPAATAESYVDSFDWDNLDRTDGRYAYVVDGVVRSSLGVDVSDNQGEVDWQAAKADGIDFVMVRLGYRGATEGDLYEDERFQANIEGARAAGLDCGVYFFSQARSAAEAVEEADFVLKRLDGVTLEYPIAFDSEMSVAGVDWSRTSDLSLEEMTAVANAFCERIEKAGHRSMIYGNAYDLARYDYDSLVDRRVWWAEYDASVPSHVMDIVMWQYSNAGVVDGIATNVDMNIDLSGVVA